MGKKKEACTHKVQSGLKKASTEITLILDLERSEGSEQKAEDE